MEPQFSFGAALTLLNQDRFVTRRGWNGKGMYLFLISDWTYTNGRNDNLHNFPFIAIKTAGDEVVPWFASQADIQAEDWMEARL